MLGKLGGVHALAIVLLVALLHCGRPPPYALRAGGLWMAHAVGAVRALRAAGARRGDRRRAGRAAAFVRAAAHGQARSLYIYISLYAIYPAIY